jgi:thiamine biosynthesis lipoprotein
VTAPGTHRTEVLMGTRVTIDVPAGGAEEAIERALAWFRQIEACCTRFNPDSEIMQLAARPGTPVPASPILFEAVQFALAVAEESGGAFDPTVGAGMERRGFNREYSTGAIRTTAIEPGDQVSFRDVVADPEDRTIMLRRPMILDLGAVAKGLAVDTAARELEPFTDFAIDAGGDLYLAGCNASRNPWSVGIRHPRLYDQMIETIHVSNCAVCTSGDYEKLDDEGRRRSHIINPTTGEDAGAVASVTVVAPTAMLADALATAAFVLGADDGIALLERVGVDGVMFSPTLDRRATAGWADRYRGTH